MDELIAGEVGYLAASIKAVADARVGDTITLKKQQAAEALAGDAAPYNSYHPLHGFRKCCWQNNRYVKLPLQLQRSLLQYIQCIYTVKLCNQQVPQCFALIS